VRVKRVFQFHPSLAYGDAISNDTFAMEHLLWRHGVRTRMYAANAQDEVAPFVRSWRDMAKERSDGAIMLLRHSMGNDVVDDVAAMTLPKVLRYHNITPAKYFVGLNEELRRYSEMGREQLKRMATQVAVAVADSEYSRRELEACGYSSTAVVPIIHDRLLERLTPDPAVGARLADGRTHLLVVGQIVPQKAPHAVVTAFARYRQSDPTAHLWIVGRADLSGFYLGTVQAEIDHYGLRDAVTITGLVSDEELAAYYRGATALVTLSEHEGFFNPGVEAMAARLPVLARDAGAIPDTLGGAGLLVSDARPDSVAASMERIVRDHELRQELADNGQKRLAAFSPESVGRALQGALALADIELPDAKRRRIVVLSSDQRCGIHDYSQAMVEGFSANGHKASFVGVRHVDSADLARKVSDIADDTDLVVVEHENGLFRDVSFVRALLSLWSRRISVVLSMHEIEPEKFHHYRRLSAALHYRPTRMWLLELLRIFWVAFLIAWAFFRYRFVLFTMGWVPKKLVVHSDRTEYWTDLLTSNRDKIEQQPLVVMPIEGWPFGARARSGSSATSEEKRMLRRSLGLPEDRFTFISPGFFFRRKRFIEVARSAPSDTTVLFSGTESQWDAGYLDDVKTYAREHGLSNVGINEEFALLGKYVAAADAMVLFYREQFQSAIATQALWAGLPCVYSDDPGFRLYRGAGLVASDEDELRRRMDEIRRPETYARLKRRVALLRRLLSPERNAQRYLTGLD